jgi:hypothetical protein
MAARAGRPRGPPPRAHPPARRAGGRALRPASARRGDARPPDRPDPGASGRRGLLGEARSRLRAQVHGDGVVAHLPRAVGGRRARPEDLARRRVRAAAYPDRERRLRDLGRADRASAAALERLPLPEREPAARDDRVRPARRSPGPRVGRLAGPLDHRRGIRGVLPLGHDGAGVRLRGQLGSSLRLGGDQGPARPRRRPAPATGGARAARDRRRRGVPAVGGPGRRRLPDRHERQLLVVQVRVPLGIRGRRAPERRGPRRARLRGALELVLSKQDERGRWRNEYPYRGKLWAEVDEPRRPSKWVTLRACAVLRAGLS